MRDISIISTTRLQADLRAFRLLRQLAQERRQAGTLPDLDCMEAEAAATVTIERIEAELDRRQNNGAD